MDVHNHNTILAKLCRICGENIILKHGYKTAKAVTDFSFVLYNNFDVDVNEESEDVYPKFLCSNCHKKIQRIGKGNTQEKKFAVKFSPHLDTGCSICHKHQRNSMFNVKDLDKELCNLGFQKLQDAKYKRIYAKLKLNDERGRIVTEILIKVTFENSWTCLVYGRDVSDYFDNILPQTISDVQEFTNFFKNHGTCKGIHK